MEKRLNIEPYNDINYKLCYHTPIFSALRYWSVDLNVFLSNDIFVYDFNKETGCILNCRNIEIIPEGEILQELGLRWYEIKKYNEEEIIGAIQKGYPVFAPIDRYYWKDSQYNAAVYMKTHKAHYFLITGYDIQKKIFIIIDIFDNGKDFKAFYNTISFSMLQKCVDMYSHRSMGVWKLSVLEGISPRKNMIKNDYKEIISSNLKTYRETIYQSFDNILQTTYYLEQISTDSLQMEVVARRCMNLYMGMNYKKVQAYEITHFWESAADTGEMFDNLSLLHYKMITGFRKMFIKRKFDWNNVDKQIQIIKQIHEEEIKAHNKLFSLL